MLMEVARPTFSSAKSRGHLQRKIVAEDYYSANTRDDACGQSLEMHWNCIFYDSIQAVG